jgi:hypothetical protein
MTEIDATGVAVRTAPAGDVGIAGDAIADRKAGHGGSNRLDDPGEFMSERHRRRTGKFAMEKMPVGAADAAGLDPHQDIVRPGHGLVDLPNDDAADALQPHRFHVCRASGVN